MWGLTYRTLSSLASSLLPLLLLLSVVTATPAHVATPLDLPNLDAMVDYRPKIPLRVYTSDGVLIGEFGQERREFVAIKDIPLLQKQAPLANKSRPRTYSGRGVSLM